MYIYIFKYNKQILKNNYINGTGNTILVLNLGQASCLFFVPLEISASLRADLCVDRAK